VLGDGHHAVEHVSHRREQVSVADRDPRPAVPQQEVQLRGGGMRADRHHARARERHRHRDLEREKRVTGQEHHRGRIGGAESRQRGGEVARVAPQAREIPEG
jgi:hypothetical protein